MGAYLSKPITDKLSTDEAEGKIKIGASSMQGWRETQEDAHNSIINFDKDTSFFAVYDGHGGREVALYCSQNLPQFIKNTEAYKSGDLSKALIDGFLGFDATLTSEDVIAELRQLMKGPNSDCDVSDEENVNKLYEEASMPLDEVIEKYMVTKKIPLLKDEIERPPVSPYLRARKRANDPLKVSESESKDNALQLCNSTELSPSASTSLKEGDTLNKKNENNTSDCQTESIVEQSKTNTEESSKAVNDEPRSAQNVLNVNDTEEKQVTNVHDKESENISGTENCPKIQEDDKQSSENEKKNTPNKEYTVAKKPQENGKINKRGKGKVFAKTKGIVTVVKKGRPKRTAQQLYRELLDSGSESESEDEEDKTFQEPIDSSSNDEDVENVLNEEYDESSSADDIEGEENSESAEEDEDEEEDDDENEEEEEDYDNDQDIDLENDVPGASSGCTAVVALMHGTQLFVANAGDSRCIICREGKAIDMSVDHKPEDTEEHQRITKAGGRVNFDGRVNGGLNLSRAIGDHSYKLNKELTDREQMITALPDIQTFTITPADEFMVLACDGIWNFMSSQEVADFVKCELEKQPEKLSQICEKLFDNCLASNTLGDGTGCDNMTAIIVTFKNGLFKRAAPCDDEESSNPKRAKTDDESIQQETAV